MADGIERELRDVDGARPLPPALYSRLEAALLEDADARRMGSDDDTAPMFASLDEPRPVPPATRAALEQALTRTPRLHRRSRTLLAAAAAVLVVAGSLAVLRDGGSHSNRQVAAGSRASVPEADVPPVLQAPTTAPAGTASAAGASGGAAQQTDRRAAAPTTTTTWNCGLCARNGNPASTAAAAAGPASGTTPQNGPQPVAASVAPGISTVEPSSGSRRGGAIVTLTGYGFTGASGVRFGSIAATNFTVVSDTEIRVMAPSSPTARKVTVAVTYPDGSSTPTSDSGPFFTYT